MKFPIPFLLLFTPSALLAQQGSEIETITIKHKQAFRGDVAAKDLPQSITTLSKDMMTDNGITKFRDALDFSASITRKKQWRSVMG